MYDLLQSGESPNNGLEQPKGYQVLVNDMRLGVHNVNSTSRDEWKTTINPTNESQAPYTVEIYTTSHGSSGAIVENLGAEGEVQVAVAVADEATDFLYWSTDGVPVRDPNLGADFETFAGPTYLVSFPVAHIVDRQIQSCDIIGYELKGGGRSTAEAGAANVSAAIKRGVNYDPKSIAIPERDLSSVFPEAFRATDLKPISDKTQRILEIGRGYKMDNTTMLTGSKNEVESEGPFSVSCVLNTWPSQPGFYEAQIVPTGRGGESVYVAHSLNGELYWVPITRENGFRQKTNSHLHTGDEKWNPDGYRERLLDQADQNQHEDDSVTKLDLRRTGQGKSVIERDVLVKIVDEKGQSKNYLIAIDYNGEDWSKSMRIRTWELEEEQQILITSNEK